MVFALALIFSLRYPRILKEETKKDVLLIKLIAIILLIIGIYFVSV